MPGKSFQTSQMVGFKIGDLHMVESVKRGKQSPTKNASKPIFPPHLRCHSILDSLNGNLSLCGHGARVGQVLLLWPRLCSTFPGCSSHQDVLWRSFFNRQMRRKKVIILGALVIFMVSKEVWEKTLTVNPRSRTSMCFKKEAVAWKTIKHWK